ncbi:WD40/YVTN/BNR-like repeat-containing protein [Pandoraea pneumonica]|uniref:WD40/YVTN/BNR-like repeat-containing protein n=1 Tax=Pandoraea pneumonica TaxID=2508299 RepID=UPI003CFAF714
MFAGKEGRRSRAVKSGSARVLARSAVCAIAVAGAIVGLGLSAGTAAASADGPTTSNTVLAAMPGTPDSLMRPAVQSARAANSVMLAITRTGKRIVAVGERGIAVWSDDNGNRWHQAQVPVSVSLTSVKFADDRHGWATGHGGVVLRSDDAGETWHKQLDGIGAARLMLEAARQGLPGAGVDPRQALSNAQRLVEEGPTKPFLDVFAFDADHAMIVGAFGLVFVTSDAGRSWHPALDRIDNPQGKHLYSMVADGDGYLIVGEQGAVFRSGDRAEHFTTLITPYAGSYFGALSTPTGSLIVYGLRGNVYTRGQVSERDAWQRSRVDDSGSIVAGIRLSTGVLVLLDDRGRVLRSDDSGLTFQAAAVPQAAPYTGAVETADGSLVLSGIRGLTRITIDGPRTTVPVWSKSE